MRCAWTTDIHLNFLSLENRLQFYQELIATAVDAVFISGDIAEAPTLSPILLEMAERIKKPLYFVLGNHDYYQGSVLKVRQAISELSATHPLLFWLPPLQAIELKPQTLLVGEDCWADGRYGDYAKSRVQLHDSHMIRELYEKSLIGKYPLLDAMRKLADRDAYRLQDNLQTAISRYQPNKIMILTHVPPFRESCMYEGKISNDDYLPFFSSKITGDLLLETASQNQDIEFLVLCGHTHGSSYYQPCHNLTVKAGSAVYMHPQIQEVLEI